MVKKLIYHLKRPFHFLKTGILKGLPAEIKNGFPARKLKIICITGTDGKTTSSTLLYHVLKAAGKKVALLTTVAAYIGDEEIDTGFHVTTPDPAQIQAFMGRLVKEGYEYLVLESTSHGIFQYRLWGVRPHMVGITNITLEHLDYHVTHDLYVQAKAMIAKHAQVTVINADDQMSFSKLKKELHRFKTKVLTYSSEDRLPTAIIRTIKSRFGEVYNQMNCRLVYLLSQQLGVEDPAYIKAIKEFPGVPGRMQTVVDQDGIQVIVDFAHTPNALEEALTAIKKKMKSRKQKGRVISIFGCAGLRDTNKRPLMGQISADLADLSIFTAEDPRTEDIWAIIRQMKQNLGSHHTKVVSIADRKEAIAYAIVQLAQAGDIIGIFGKGHEKSLCYGTTEYPWSDAVVAKEMFALRKPSQREDA